ncbi:MAG: hypothetical protein J5898_02735 [Lachnospiraceae bacterium]|nr:hypothetical protein [Lachnospiraceae bacterium]
MRMFGYYAFHSFINQLKKIFKTWIMVFIVVMLIFGVLVGLIAGGIASASEKRKQQMQQAEEMIQEMQEQEAEEAAEAQVESFKEKMDRVIGMNNLIELIVGAVLILVLGLSVVNADKSSGKIFLPADVTLLFSSPLKPQSVMLFRLSTQLGSILIMGIYFLGQLPNLTINLGLSPWTSLTMILAFSLSIMYGLLLQLLLYSLSSVSADVKKWFRPALGVLLLAVTLGFILYQKGTGLEYAAAATAFFNGRLTRLIPIWGWMKGLVMYSIEDNLSGFGMCLAVLILFGIFLIYMIWNIKADFYEDAMAKSEEVAELLERAKTDRSTGRRRKKDRNEKLKRDGMRYGLGANVFFFKSMYNRFRFAHFGIFTKTMEVYFAAAVIIGLLCRYSFMTKSVLPLAITFGILVFLRSLGNPLEEDTKMDYFIMIPEDTWMKVFWSLMAGVANTAMDLILPLILGALIIGANPLLALPWLLIILSVDIYSTLVGAFIFLSVPVSAGYQIKQMIQIMFIYFGLLPDITVLGVGIALGHTTVSLIIATAINLALGAIFFGLAPIFLEPKGGTAPKSIKSAEK